MDNSELNLCFVLDKNYIDKLKVTLFSIFSSNGKYKFRIHIINNNFKENDKIDLTRFIDEFGSKVLYYDCQTLEFENLISMNNNYVSYLKTLIPYLINVNNKLLYLDCDILVLGDIGELFHSVTNHFISAVPDSFFKKRKTHVGKITGSENNIYFNSGVILFDFSHQSEIITKTELMNFLNTSKELILFHDQDIFNHFYATKYCKLDYIYNTFAHFNIINSQRNKKQKPIILHYANLKPWNSNYIGKYRKLYLKYYNKIAKNEKLSFVEKSNLFLKIKVILKRLTKR